jgi:hypothetical protein
VGAGADRSGLCGVRGEPAAGGPLSRAAGVSGAKSDPRDANVLADMVRTDSHQLRTVAGDSDQAEAIKVVTRTPLCQTRVTQETNES